VKLEINGMKYRHFNF